RLGTRTWRYAAAKNTAKMNGKEAFMEPTTLRSRARPKSPEGRSRPPGSGEEILCLVAEHHCFLKCTTGMSSGLGEFPSVTLKGWLWTTPSPRRRHLSL